MANFLFSVKNAAQRLVALVLLLFSSSNYAETVHIAVASNFTATIRHLVTVFEQEFGHSVIVSFGSSGKLYAQIQHGAPYMLFFSADQSKPTALVNAGLAVQGSQYTYARGTLVLWSSSTDMIDAKASRLFDGAFDRLAIANPRLAPYGVAAVQVMQNLNLFEALHSKIVRGENISQTYQYIRSGNAELGFIAYSQLLLQHAEGRARLNTASDSGEWLTNNKGSYWVVPPRLYDPIRQDFVLLNKGRQSAAALALSKFVRSENSQAIIETYGYSKAPRHD